MSEEESLEEILKNLLASIPEVQSAAVVSIEGLPIASALPPDVDETRIAAMTAAILSLAERAAQEFGKGLFEQVFVRGQNGYVLTMAAGANAVLTISTSKNVKLGLIFLDTKRTCDKIAKFV
ncbi:roadblock/LC7 domain-containing protein [Promethearchaeum syntrophicum]|uniref:Roadblock/LC7 domain-containing protein n=1 Tax=Promethearchaeum syntrophicum TaxID=2594042 RepID=A0A5B9DG51_9ARCH